MCASAIAPFQALHYEEMYATLIDLLGFSCVHFIKPKEQAATSLHENYNVRIYRVYTLA